jgi:hypothetical protein
MAEALVTDVRPGEGAALLASDDAERDLGLGQPNHSLQCPSLVDFAMFPSPTCSTFHALSAKGQLQ